MFQFGAQQEYSWEKNYELSTASLQLGNLSMFKIDLSVDLSSDFFLFYFKHDQVNIDTCKQPYLNINTLSNLTQSLYKATYDKIKRINLNI